MTVINGTPGNNNLSGGAGDDTIRGLDGNDSLFGLGGNDIIIGGNGNDFIDGGAGNDELTGGNGIDTVSYALATAGVTVDISITGSLGGEAPGGPERGTPQDTIGAGIDTLIDLFENLSGSQHDDLLTGNALANVIRGLGGVDTIHGGDGNDTLSGGTGNDTLDGGAGNDLIMGDSGNDAMAGGDGDDVFSWVGITGQDSFDGGSGYDVIRAGANNATLNWDGSIVDVEAISGGGFANVKILGGTGADAIDLSGFALDSISVIDGYSGNDTITGSTGADMIRGGVGVDTLAGGLGADIFDYDRVAESSKASGSDTITDFDVSSDKIDLQTIDANSKVAGNDSFTFIGGAAFSGAAGELRVEQVGGNTFVLGDTNGDRHADLSIILTGNHDLTAANVVL